LRGSPEFWPYLTALRLEQAALRTAARLIGGADAEVVTLLVPQLQEEAARLGRWLAVGAPAAGGTPREALTETIETAAFLVAYCRQRGTLERTGGLAALGRALSHVADAWGK
jgi:hypothetical protein